MFCDTVYHSLPVYEFPAEQSRLWRAVICCYVLMSIKAVTSLRFAAGTYSCSKAGRGCVRKHGGGGGQPNSGHGAADCKVCVCVCVKECV